MENQGSSLATACMFKQNSIHLYCIEVKAVSCLCMLPLIEYIMLWAKTLWQTGIIKIMPNQFLAVPVCNEPMGVQTNWTELLNILKKLKKHDDSQAGSGVTRSVFSHDF